jgi:inosose dehydratase
MQTVPVDDALRHLRTIGYDGAELCLMPGWPTEAGKLDRAARKRIRDTGFPVPTLIENFNTLVDAAENLRTLDRIRAAAELAHDIAPKDPPILQSVLGGKPDSWEQSKEQMASRLGEWARVAQQSGIRLAVKSHIGSASNTPEKLLWLLDRVDNPALSGIYDYSHFQLMGLSLRETLNSLLPRSTFVTVKDGTLVDGAPRFLLPGEGTVEYQEYFSLLKSHAYRGWILVEISRQLQTKPGFDPVQAASKAYANMAPLLESAGLRVARRGRVV